ncbi:fucolectin-7-like isoform X1 [Fundulus heteroclitus]|uniref:fucolectin-7-like isoform X1 n=1 Tax=Fundulus heteroclitus TaxID=8078 RepID=UPI00165CAB94|nr:fucolectin-7-like isoform X1 [Fundulus heteroclitus]
MGFILVLQLLLFLPTCFSCRYRNVALQGKATQSWRYKGDWDAFVDAYNAIDGNRDPDLRKGSCTHTAAHDNPWWRVDLLDSYVVDQISITNRQDCCTERINGAEIHIGNSLKDEGASNPLVATVSSIQGGSNLTIKLPEGVEGRYVTILLPGPSRILTLCEVEVCGYPAPTGENLALDGKATQSSLYGSGLPYNAIDGNRNNNWEQASCSHTTNDYSPWWRLDLRTTHKVLSIKIVNRDILQQRLDGAEIRIGDSLFNNGNYNPRCATISAPGGSLEFECNGLEGRYVNVVIPWRKEYLTLCEVEVYGSRLE